MGGDHLNVVSDMILAGIVTVGFAVFYNTAWPHIGLAAAGGMIGHGLRFIALEAGWRLEVATFLGGFAVGVVSAWIARTYKLPIAVISFAGAVTMMPGIQIYRPCEGAPIVSVARYNEVADDSRDTWRCVASVLGLGSDPRSVQLGLAWQRCQRSSGRRQ